MADYIVHTPEEINRIRIAAAATARVRDGVKRLCQVGMSTRDLDQIAGDLIGAEHGRSSFLGYYGYPGNICISLNEEVVHGIGSTGRIITENDLISIDVGVEINGATGDCALTFGLKEELNAEDKMLLEYTEKALYAGIAAAVKGNYIGDISLAIESVAKQVGLGVVRDYVGHGCGISLHEPPEIPNFVSGERGPKLRAGMVLAIEPMFNLGTHKVVVDKLDHWTVRTKDGRNSAHFEHLILITDKEPEILTWQKMM